MARLRSYSPFETLNESWCHSIIHTYTKCAASHLRERERTTNDCTLVFLVREGAKASSKQVGKGSNKRRDLELPTNKCTNKLSSINLRLTHREDKAEPLIKDFNLFLLQLLFVSFHCVFYILTSEASFRGCFFFFLLSFSLV